MASGCHWGKKGGEPDAKTPASPLDAAVTLRVTIEGMMREVLFRTAIATEALVTLDKKTYGPSGDALDDVAVALAKEIASIFPSGDTEKKALPAVRAIGGVIVSYAIATRPLSTKNKKVVAKQKKQLASVESDARKAAHNFGDLIASLTPVLLPGKVAGQLIPVLATMRSMVDLQRKKDFNGAANTVRIAADQVATVADLIAGAIVDELPAQFDGLPTGPSADFRSKVEGLLKERVFLLGWASQGQQAGFPAGFTAARGALDQNTTAMAQAIGSIYGADVEKAFLPLWQRHIELLVTYLTNPKDKGKQDKAVQDLTQYSMDFGTFLAGANSQLKAADVTKFISDHITEMKLMIDAQIGGSFIDANTVMHTAIDHIDGFAAALADATVKMLPKKFIL